MSEDNLKICPTLKWKIFKGMIAKDELVLPLVLLTDDDSQLQLLVVTHRLHAVHVRHPLPCAIYGA